MAKLVNGHAEGNPNLRVQLEVAAGEMVDQEIELRLAAQAAEHDLGGQTCIAGVQPRRKCREEVRCVSSATDAFQYIESGFASTRHDINVAEHA